MPKDSGIGAASKRREDFRFLTGRGKYTDDVALQGQLQVCAQSLLAKIFPMSEATPPVG